MQVPNGTEPDVAFSVGMSDKLKMFCENLSQFSKTQKSRVGNKVQFCKKVKRLFV